MKHPRPRFPHLKIAEPEVRRLERIHLQHVAPISRHDGVKREGELERVQHQVLILYHHPEAELRIRFAVTEPCIPQHTKRVSEERPEAETDEIPGSVRLRLKRKQKPAAARKHGAFEAVDAESVVQSQAVVGEPVDADGELWFDELPEFPLPDFEQIGEVFHIRIENTLLGFATAHKRLVLHIGA